jgi:hypothetical protein
MVHHLGVGYKFRKPFTDCKKGHGPNTK